jgi:hypothetical protein
MKSYIPKIVEDLIIIRRGLKLDGCFKALTRSFIIAIQIIGNTKIIITFEGVGRGQHHADLIFKRHLHLITHQYYYKNPKLE